MCGFSGTFNTRGIEDRTVTAKMTSQLLHRGPDEIWSLDLKCISAKLARLGMNGLGRGWQPATDSSGRYIALTNGEIYNSLALRESLSMGDSTNAVDVAVIPELFMHKGVKGLELIDGQFSTMILDTVEECIFLARDRFGICPLYYAISDDESVHFCSELKPLVNSLPKQCHVDITAIDQYFSLGNIVSPNTIVDEVKSVPPGCAIAFKPETPPILQRYWRYGDFTEESSSFDEIRDILQSAVKSRLQADVEIGSYLSGGFDSSLLVALSSQFTEHRLHTFASVFDDPLLDESEFQEQVANMYGTDHHRVPCDFKDTAAEFESMVRHCCAPQRESYNVAARKLSAAVSRTGIKGVLSGEGADELFFGYDSYAFDSLGRSKTRSDSRNEQAWGDAQFAWEVDWQTAEARKYHYLSAGSLEALKGKEFWRSRIIPFGDDEVARLSRMQMRSIADVHVQLSGHLLGDHGDSMLMANSVEGRYPFLSNAVTDLALRTSDTDKVVDFEGKACLKSSMKSFLPFDVVERSKQGFTAPSLRDGVSQGITSRWDELMQSTPLLNSKNIGGSMDKSNGKWDFKLSAVSIAMIIDELNLDVPR